MGQRPRATHCPNTINIQPARSRRKRGPAESSYYSWVNRHNTFGLGNDVPMSTGNLNDGLIAYTNGRMVVFGVPYPIGFYAKGFDGRIDDPKAGWKGRGLWAANGNRTPSPSKAARARSRSRRAFPAASQSTREIGCGHGSEFCFRRSEMPATCIPSSPSLSPSRHAGTGNRCHEPISSGSHRVAITRVPGSGTVEDAKAIIADARPVAPAQRIRSRRAAGDAPPWPRNLPAHRAACGPQHGCRRIRHCGTQAQERLRAPTVLHLQPSIIRSLTDWNGGERADFGIDVVQARVLCAARPIGSLLTGC